MRVVVAFDSFKGSASAAGAGRAFIAGWRSVRPGDELRSTPVADGGEGTLEALWTAIPDARLTAPRTVAGPDGRPVRAGWLALPDGTAVVELATTSGLPLIGRLDPLGAHTRGLGELCRIALAAGANALTIAVGGSASTDGGAGALAALGARLLDEDGRDLPPGGGALRGLARFDPAEMLPAPPGGVRVLVDVTAPLLGPEGAAVVFAPQKGASPSQVRTLEAALARLAEVLGGDPDAPGAGAAGGTGYGLAAGWGARLAPGGPAVVKAVGLAAALAKADLVVTGEGRFDATSAQGKATGVVLRLAAETGTPAALVAGTIAAPLPGVRGLALADLLGSARRARAAPLHALRAAGAWSARQLGS